MLEEIAASRELEILEYVAGIPHEDLNKKGYRRVDEGHMV
jgi:hypothetical protein